MSKNRLAFHSYQARVQRILPETARRDFLARLRKLLKEYGPLLAQHNLHLAVIEQENGLSTRVTRQIDAIIDYVALASNVPADRIRRRDRRQAVAEARFLCLLFMQDFLGLNDTQAAAIFGMDRTTSGHARKWCEAMADAYPSTFGVRLANLRAELRNVLSVADASDPVQAMNLLGKNQHSQIPKPLSK